MLATTISLALDGMDALDGLPESRQSPASFLLTQETICVTI
jgi:hypothetical protein